jgi:hypothetical protein
MTEYEMSIEIGKPVIDSMGRLGVVRDLYCKPTRDEENALHAEVVLQKNDQRIYVLADTLTVCEH